MTSSKWIAAAIELGTNPTAKVLCPECESEYLAVRDIYPTLGAEEFERYLECSNCKARNVMRMKRRQSKVLRQAVTDIGDLTDDNASQMPIAAIIDQGEPLRAVHCIFDEDLPKGPVAIIFTFETSSFCALVNASDDSLSTSSALPLELQSHARSKVDDNSAPWNQMIGAALIWSWRLTNQQGYSDGLQLEFRRDGHGALACVQLIAIASTLELRSLAREAFAVR
jgi:Family of unknown function (DUF6334)